MEDRSRPRPCATCGTGSSTGRGLVMLASEKMAQRVVEVQKLIKVDDRLKFMFSQEPTNRVIADARKLLGARSKIVMSLVEVDYEPWPVPADIEEARWVV